MASTTTEKKTAETKPATNGNGTHVAPPPKKGPPEGYSRSGVMVELPGYWQPEKGPVHGKLIGAYDFRQKSGKGKGQLRRMYVVKLIDPCFARVVVEGPSGKKSFDEGTLDKGELCGIFGTAGLRDLDNLGSCNVWADRDLDEKGKQREKETARGFVKLFDIRHSGTAKPLKVKQARAPEVHEEAVQAEGDDEELPF